MDVDWKLLLDSYCIVFVGSFEEIQNSLHFFFEATCRERKQVGFSSILDLGCGMGIGFFVDDFFSCLREKEVENCVDDTCNLLNLFLRKEEEKKLKETCSLLLDKFKLSCKDSKKVERKSLLFLFRDWFAENFPISYKELLKRDLIEVVKWFDLVVFYDVKFQVETEAVREAVFEVFREEGKVTVIKQEGEESGKQDHKLLFSSSRISSFESR